MQSSSATFCGTGRQGCQILPLQTAVRKHLQLQPRAQQPLSCREARLSPLTLFFPYLIKFDKGFARAGLTVTQAHISSTEAQHRRAGTGAALRSKPASPTALQASLLTAESLLPPPYLGFCYGHFWSTRKDISVGLLQKQKLILG